MDDQVVLYNRLGKKPPLGSAHCSGCAMDLADPDGKLFELLSKPENLILLGIYLEAKSATPTWTHVQWTPPKSGRRIFNP